MKACNRTSESNAHNCQTLPHSPSVCWWLSLGQVHDAQQTGKGMGEVRQTTQQPDEWSRVCNIWQVFVTQNVGSKSEANQTPFVDSLVTCPNVPVLAGHPPSLNLPPSAENHGTHLCGSENVLLLMPAQWLTCLLWLVADASHEQQWKVHICLQERGLAPPAHFTEPQSGGQMADMAPVHPGLQTDNGWVQKCLNRDCAGSEAFIQILWQGRNPYLQRNHFFCKYERINLCINLYICTYAQNYMCM